MTPVLCLATAIFFEARGEPLEGKLAVAQVVLNRVESPRWENDICGVVFEGSQFSFTHDGKSDNIYRYKNVLEKRAATRAVEIAEAVLSGEVSLGVTSTHYHTIHINPYWTEVYELDGRIGNHIFYTCSEEERNC